MREIKSTATVMVMAFGFVGALIAGLTVGLTH